MKTRDIFKFIPIVTYVQEELLAHWDTIPEGEKMYVGRLAQNAYYRAIKAVRVNYPEHAMDDRVPEKLIIKELNKMRDVGREIAEARGFRSG